MKLNFWRFRELKRGITNIFYYLPLIWKDRDWDHAYMEDIMLAKFKKWYKRYSSDNIPLPYMDMEKDLQAMRICIQILERRKNSWYSNVWHSKYAYKEEHYFEPIPNSKNFEWKTRGLTPEEAEKSSEWLNKCNKVEIRDWKIFCLIFEKYFNKWWD